MNDKFLQKDISTERLRIVVDKSQQTREKIAEGVGMDTSTITKYYNGDRNLTVEAIKKFSHFFGVSADYLLGLSDAETNDKDKQFVCDYTGLSAESVEKLVDRKAYFPFENYLSPSQISLFSSALADTNPFDEYAKCQSDFIKSNSFELIISLIYFEKRLSSLLEMINDKINNNEDIAECFSLFELQQYNVSLQEPYNQHRLNLFNIQDHITSYLKDVSKIEELGVERCNELSNSISMAFENFSTFDYEEDELDGNDN